jgi:hypothetical protein
VSGPDQEPAPEVVETSIRPWRQTESEAEMTLILAIKMIFCIAGMLCLVFVESEYKIN